MKTLLLLLFSAITLATQAQTSVYHPFPDSNAVWNQNYVDYYPIYCEGDTIYFSYVLKDDTLINSLNYHKVYRPYFYEAGISCGVGLFYSGPYIGALRQDTSIKKVYFLFDKDSLEILLYDFNAMVGDSVPILNYGNHYSSLHGYVYAIDSVLIGSTYRKMQIISGPGNIEIIEGVGCIGGLLEIFPPNVSGFFCGLICFSENALIKYPYWATSCNIISSTNNLSENNAAITLFPNPATNFLTISTNTNTPSEIILSDIASRKLLQQKFTVTVTLNTENLAKGIYLYEARDANGVIKQGRVVKE